MQDDLKKILEFRDKRNWKRFHLPKNIAISLVLEANELLEIFQWSEDNNLPLNKKKALSHELADVYYYLLLLAYEAKIDLKKAFKEKMRINNKKYPIKKAKGKSVKYTEFI